MNSNFHRANIVRDQTLTQISQPSPETSIILSHFSSMLFLLKEAGVKDHLMQCSDETKEIKG